MTGAFSHSPLSGLETGEPGVPDFYRDNELKYHGRANRGVTTINFMQVKLQNCLNFLNRCFRKRNMRGDNADNHLNSTLKTIFLP